MPTILDLVTRAFDHWDDAATLQDIGYELEQRSRFEHAERVLRRAIELAPNDVPNAYLSLAWVLMRSGTAEQEVDAKALIATGIDRTGSALVRAWGAGVSDDNDNARSTFSTLLAMGDSDLNMSIANAMLWQGMEDEAYSIIQDAEASMHLTTSAEALSSYLNVISALARSKKMELDAVQYRVLVDRLIEIDPTGFGSYSCGIGVYRSASDHSGAVDVAARGLRHLPDDETLMLMRGDSLLQLDDLHHAEHWLLRAIGAKPSFIGARIVLARAYDKADRIDDALGLVREFPTANPDYAWGLIMGAALLWKHGHTDEAVAMARGAVGRVPGWAAGHLETNETYKALWAAVTA